MPRREWASKGGAYFVIQVSPTSSHATPGGEGVDAQAEVGFDGGVVLGHRGLTDQLHRLPGRVEAPGLDLLRSHAVVLAELMGHHRSPCGPGGLGEPSHLLCRRWPADLPWMATAGLPGPWSGRCPRWCAPPARCRRR